MAIRKGKSIEGIGYGYVTVYYATSMKAAEAYAVVEERKDMLCDSVRKIQNNGRNIDKILVDGDGEMYFSQVYQMYWQHLSTFKKVGEIKLYGETAAVYGEHNMTDAAAMLVVTASMETLEDKAQHLRHNGNGSVIELKVFKDASMQVHTDYVGYWFTV